MMATKKYASLETLREFLESCKTLFAGITHKHTISDITDYVVDSKLSDTSNNPVQNAVITAEIEGIKEELTQKVQIITWEAND